MRWCICVLVFLFFQSEQVLHSSITVVVFSPGCRCRDKQRKESSRLQAVNRKLSAMNKLLMEENERLQKQVSQLVRENAYMKQQLQNVSIRFLVLHTIHDTQYCLTVVTLCSQPALANDTSCESNVTAPPNPLRDATNPAGYVIFVTDSSPGNLWGSISFPLSSRNCYMIFLSFSLDSLQLRRRP